MRASRILLVLLGGLLAATLAAAVVLPALLDWTRYRGTIEALATSSIGRLVRIEGDVSLELLPQPVLTAGRISVADIGDGLALSARDLRLRVGLGALLSGRLDPRELTLRGASLRLPWPLAPAALTEPPAWLAALQVRVENSRVEIGDFAMTGINAGLGTDRDTGTLSVAGVGQYGGRTWHVTARLGQPGRDGSATVEASVDGQGAAQDTGGTFSGQIGRDGALSGRVSGRGPDLSQILPTPAVAWRAEGRLLLQSGLAIADELALQIGGSPARGAVALRVGPDARLDLAVAASQLDLDAWLPVLARGAGPTLPTSLDLSAEAATLAGGTLRHLRGAFDLNGSGVAVRELTTVLPGEAQLSVSGTMQRAPAAVPPAAPGPAPATPAPAAPPAAAPPSAAPAILPRFQGTGRLAAPDLRTTLRWIEPLLPSLATVLPPSVLRTAQLTASIGTETGQIALTDLAGTLDGARVSGAASLRLGGARPHLGAGLTFDTLSLDAWLPSPRAILSQATLAALPGLFAGLDLELRLDARRASWNGAALSGLVVDAQAEAGRLTARRLDFRLGGTRVSLSGAVEEGGRTDARFEAAVADAATLQPVLEALLPDWTIGPGLLRGQASAQGSVAGPPDALALRLNATLGDLQLEAQPTISLAARRLVGPVSLRHPGAPRLLETLGIAATVGWLGDGSFSLRAQLDAQLLSQNGGSAARIAAEYLDVSAGSLRASGQLTWDGRDGSVLTGRIAAETLPLPLLYPYSPDPLPVAVLRGWRATLSLTAAHVLVGLTPVADAASADLALQSGQLRLDRFRATVAGGTLGGRVLLDTAAEPPRLQLKGTLDGASLTDPLLDQPLDLLAARQVDGNVDLSAAGYSPAGLLASLSGSAGAAVRGALLSGFDLGAAGVALRQAWSIGNTPAAAAALEAALRTAASAGTTAAEELTLALQVDRGVVRLDASRLAGPAGVAVLAGTLDLPTAAADLRIGLQPTATAEDAPFPEEPGALPEIGLRLTGELSRLRRTLELAAALRWLAERPAPGTPPASAP